MNTQVNYGGILVQIGPDVVDKIGKNLYEWTYIKKYNIDDIICIDETSINALQKRHHCYNTIGKRCTLTHWKTSTDF